VLIIELSACEETESSSSRGTSRFSFRADVRLPVNLTAHKSRSLRVSANPKVPDSHAQEDLRISTIRLNEHMLPPARVEILSKETPFPEPYPLAQKIVRRKSLELQRIPSYEVR